MIATILESSTRCLEKYRLEIEISRDENSYREYLINLDRETSTMITYLGSAIVMKKAIGESLSFDEGFRGILMGFLNANVERAKSGNPDDSELKSLFTASQEILHRMSQSWVTYANDKSKATINTLQVFSRAFDGMSEAVQIALRLKDLSSRLPKSEQEIQKFDQDLERGLSIIKSVDADDDVKRFIEMTVAGEASVADLTPKIVQWLTQKNLATRMMIQI
jgi:hypothetical protein